MLLIETLMYKVTLKSLQVLFWLLSILTNSFLSMDLTSFLRIVANPWVTWTHIFLLLLRMHSEPWPGDFKGLEKSIWALEIFLSKSWAVKSMSKVWCRLYKFVFPVHPPSGDFNAALWLPFFFFFGKYWINSVKEFTWGDL